MNNKVVYLAVLLFGLLVACKQDAGTSQGMEASKKSSGMVKPVTVLTNPDGTKRKAWAILTADIWQYEFALTIGESPKENIYEGYWIDFEDDFTFVKGKYTDTLSVGEYNFDFDSKILEILPTAGKEGPTEYRIQTNGEIIIFIGTAKYGNNGTQIKLKRVRSIPTPEKAE